MLASTMSSASFGMSSSLGPRSGERGSAMSPVRADSRIPNGPISFMNESIRVGLAELYILSVCNLVKTEENDNLHFDNTVIRANIQHLPTKLMGKVRN